MIRPLPHLTFAAVLACTAAACVPTNPSTTFDEVPNYLELPGGKTSVRFETSIVEDGEPIRLHLLIYRPRKGDGPFPLLVFNHGGADAKKKPHVAATSIRQTHYQRDIASFFRDHGWMVAVVHRRGRGWSDGRIDEIHSDRRGKIRSCEPQTVARGLGRALTDVEEAMRYLTTKEDVDPSRIVIGGSSYGGFLSVAYAGKHPNEISGVLNFVGGVIATCKRARENNIRTAAIGAAFPKPMLWVYGDDDETFPHWHARTVFQSFEKKGGKGTFVLLANATHSLLRMEPHRWRPLVADYMTNLGFTEFSQ